MKCPHCGEEIEVAAPPVDAATEAEDFTTGGEFVALVESVELREFSPLTG